MLQGHFELGPTCEVSIDSSGSGIEPRLDDSKGKCATSTLFSWTMTSAVDSNELDKGVCVCVRACVRACGVAGISRRPNLYL